MNDKNYEQGQRDGSNNVYRQPVPDSPLDVSFPMPHTEREWKEMNDSYDKGWTNGYKQR